MKKYLLLIIVLSSLSALGQKPKLKEEIEISVKKPLHKNRIDNFTIYNRDGKEIEFGRYGETTCRVVKTLNKDSTIRIATGCSWDYTKIESIDFSSYDSIGRLSEKETWFYKDNKKDWLSGRTVFHYGPHNHLMKEIEYNDTGKIDKTVSYLYDRDNNQIEEVDSDFAYSFTQSGTSVLKIFYYYDSTKRIVSEIDTSDKHILLRRKYIYPLDTNAYIVLRYDNESDTSLFLITETKYTYKNSLIFSKEIHEVSYFRLNKDPIDTIRDYDKYVRIYYPEGNLKRINHYHSNDFSVEPKLEDYTIYKYY